MHVATLLTRDRSRRWRAFALACACCVALALTAACGDATSPSGGTEDAGSADGGAPDPDTGETEEDVAPVDVEEPPPLDIEDSETGDDADSGPCNTLGCPCTDDTECQSGYCISTGPGTGVCSELCDEGCSDPDYDCRTLVNSAGDAVRLCVPQTDSYCQPCAASSDCGDLRAACYGLADGSRACITPCDETTLCAEGASCQTVNVGDISGEYCVPDADICTGCLDRDGDQHGIGPDCIGPDADDSDDTVYDGAPELCDGLDNDGNGETDEGFDLSSDPRRCGRCDNVCSFQNAAAACMEGVCVIDACLEGFADCNGSEGDGCEVDTTSNPFDCGACGNACARPNADTACEESACVIVECDTNFGDCDLDAENGCEAALLTDLDHCGACDALCAFDDALAQCSGGVCGLGDCDDGFSDCDADASNGCETSIVDNDAACGGCGLVCDPVNGLGECQGRDCVILGCFGNYADCDLDPFTGCEADTFTSLDHCGGCGLACAAENGATVCDRGACVIDGCDEDFADCDGELDNGCETFLLGNIAACGACDNPCLPVPNAEVDCASTTCTITACDAGFADCNGDYADGCEADLTSTATCLSCDNTCAFANGVAGCGASGCFLEACAPGFFNADGDATNGCEYACEISNGGVELCDDLDNDCDGSIDEDFAFATDESNCGSCGNACEASEAAGTCVEGSCAFVCNAGWGNCDDDFETNGCEANLQVDPSNCNTCGNACDLPGGTNVCVEGACAVSECTEPFADCTAAPGCETDTRTDATHCGECGNACSTNNVASGGCEDGGCVITACVAGFGDCDGDASNGCETNLNTSPSSCGACGNTCTNTNGSTSCLSGTCSPVCDFPYGDCDGDPDNGCELSMTSLSSCGACGRSCNLSNASESCASGTCRVTSCESGYCDADGTSSNGCEFDLDTEPACGSFAEIGTVNGDTGSATIRRTGYGESRYRVRVNEGNSNPFGCYDLGLTIRLFPPEGADYDLTAWCDGCSGSGASSSNGGTTTDSVILRWDESCILGFPANSDSGRDINILVRYFNANTCAPFTLEVTGNQFSGSNTCSDR